ncbi:molecular chaperone TorD [Vibrio sp. SCSIO 43137]|uniref:molecular chaperone TorD n=1 Tax=Vibrio sp. SCSIO 43137 TaxID=3021011 RepID=UPI0023081A66|nr:molecular chaperone TorD [Vibrio sp. SCSIO 43137]WCE28557.1 molecular chaperone TorD [Vibrio sp. SCSIO 43137]
MEETKAFNEKRAEIYWWLSSLFAKELTEKDVQAYHSPEIRSFLTGLGENPTLKPSVDKMVDALNRLQDREDAQLELAADFCGLFLQTDKSGALPYASMYIGENGLLNDKPAQEMQKLMQSQGVDVHSDLNEPADHIAIELDFLGNMIIRSNELEKLEHIDQALLEQKAFIETYLLSWIPEFSKKCSKFDDFGFYSSVSTLLVDFLKLDCTYLAGE